MRTSPHQYEAPFGLRACKAIRRRRMEGRMGRPVVLSERYLRDAFWRTFVVASAGLERMRAARLPCSGGIAFRRNLSSCKVREVLNRHESL